MLSLLERPRSRQHLRHRNKTGQYTSLFLSQSINIAHAYSYQTYVGFKPQRLRVSLTSLLNKCPLAAGKEILDAVKTVFCSRYFFHSKLNLLPRKWRQKFPSKRLWPSTTVSDIRSQFYIIHQFQVQNFYFYSLLITTCFRNRIYCTAEGTRFLEGAQW